MHRARALEGWVDLFGQSLVLDSLKCLCIESLIVCENICVLAVFSSRRAFEVDLAVDVRCSKFRD